MELIKVQSEIDEGSVSLSKLLMQMVFTNTQKDTSPNTRNLRDSRVSIYAIVPLNIKEHKVLNWPNLVRLFANKYVTSDMEIEQYIPKNF